jgi:protein O-GlcNAc transferase
MPPAPPVTDAEFQQLTALYGQGALLAADALADRLVARAPANPDLWNVRGLIAYRRADFTLAVQRLSEAARLAPADAGIHSNLGAALRSTGDLDAAEAVYRRAIAAAPTLQALHANLANVELDRRRAREAEACVREALRHGPPTANLLTTLGIALNLMGRLVEAAEALRGALAINPRDYDACRNLGSTLAGMAQFDEAEDLHRRAMDLRPDYAAGYSSLLFNLNYRPDLTAEAIAAEYRRFARTQTAHLPPPAPHANDRDPDRRLRIGYVSPDFCDHVVASFMLPILAAHDKSEVEIVCYAEVRSPDGTSRRIMEIADAWVPTVGLSDEALAERIRADAIDILIDLAGHTTGNRLMVFARRPAPVQLTYFIGHGTTTGLPQIDGFLSDAALTPPGCEALFGEQTIVRLDRAALAYVAAPHMPAVAPTPALANGFVTFGYFGRSVRLNEGVIAAWSAILKAVPTSRLTLNYASFGDPATAALFADRFARYGVERERLDLIFTSPQTTTWAAYGAVDIALDPFPHNAGTTTIEALWMGVPVLTLADRPSLGRMGAMILEPLALGDWVAEDVAAYVAKAVAAARDLEGLAALRAGMRERFRASALGDVIGLTRSMERAYRAAWRNWCDIDHRP